MNDILNNNYHISTYKEFRIYEPKERIIRTLKYCDRVVHQWYIYEFIIPFFVKRFIADSYACIVDKGTHKAIKRVQYFMRKMEKLNNKYYVIKCDIKKYFENINKDTLYSILIKRMKDKKLISFTYQMIYENNNFNGICIGNYTSQYFANIYLNELDYYIKFNLKIKCYVRYMDDFILLVDNKQQAKMFYQKIELFLNNKLNLELNTKSKYYPSKLGIDFCGYIIYENYLKIRKRCKIKINQKIKLWNYLYINNRLNYQKYLLSYNSFLGHIKHSSSYNYQKKIESKMWFK